MFWAVWQILRRSKIIPAQVVLRWPTRRGVVAIPKSVKKKRIRENFNIFDFKLSAEDMEAVKAMDTRPVLQ